MSDASEREPNPSASSNLFVKKRERKEILTAELPAALNHSETKKGMTMLVRVRLKIFFSNQKNRFIKVGG